MKTPELIAKVTSLVRKNDSEPMRVVVAVPGHKGHMRVTSVHKVRMDKEDMIVLHTKEE